MKRQFLSVYLLAGLISLSIAGVFWFFFHVQLERTKPEIIISGIDKYIGINQTLELKVSDLKAGIRKVNVTLLQDGVTHSILSRDLGDSATAEMTFNITIQPQQLKLKEQEAQLIVSATDNSWWENSNKLQRTLLIDMTPPLISILTPTNYLNPGGTGAIAFKSSESLALSGVMVNADLTAAYQVWPDKYVMISYFPIPKDAKQGLTRIMVVAQDQAGNKAQISLPHLIREKKFTPDRMTLSNRFLQEKMPEFASRFSDLQGKSPLEIFVYVNDRMRRENFKQIQEICANSSPKHKWQGTFLRMHNASTMAGFGEKRTYLYEGKVVGESIHEGVDLASNTNAPIQAANHGSVSFAGYLGIYGNTVIIDHGLGLFSLYSHLNDITVAKGAEVKKGDAIGTSGTSGLAGGDHLHFAMIAGGQFVNPVEWWDPKWIADNVTNKLAAYAQLPANQ